MSDRYRCHVISRSNRRQPFDVGDISDQFCGLSISIRWNSIVNPMHFILMQWNSTVNPMSFILYQIDFGHLHHTNPWWKSHFDIVLISQCYVSPASQLIWKRYKYNGIQLPKRRRQMDRGEIYEFYIGKADLNMIFDIISISVFRC